MVPTPPQIAGQSPEPLLGRSNETAQGAGLAHDRSDLGGSLRQHLDLIFPKSLGFDPLHNENALQHASLNERDSEKRLVSIFARFREVLKAPVTFHLTYVYRAHLLGNQAGETLVYSHTKSANALRSESDRRG